MANGDDSVNNITSGSGGISDGKRQLSPEELAAKQEAEIKNAALFQQANNHSATVRQRQKLDKNSLWHKVNEIYPGTKGNPTATANCVNDVAKENDYKDPNKLPKGAEIDFPGQTQNCGVAYGESYQNLVAQKKKEAQDGENAAIASTDGVNDKLASAKEADNEGTWAAEGAKVDANEKEVVANANAAQAKLPEEVAKAEKDANATVKDAANIAPPPEPTPTQVSFNFLTGK